MGVSKLVLYTPNGEDTKFDLTGDTVTASDLAEGVTAHGADGEPIVGTMPTDVVRYDTVQILTETQRQRARANIGITDNPSGGGSSGGYLMITFSSVDGETYTTDTTFAEVATAFASGRTLCANIDDYIYSLYYHDESCFSFSLIKIRQGKVKELRARIYDDGTAEVSAVPIRLRELTFDGLYGCPLYVTPDGEITALSIGEGLKIENGALMLDGTVTPDTPVTPSKTAICGTFLCGEVICGEV